MRNLYRKPRPGEPFKPNSQMFGMFIETAEKVEALKRVINSPGKHKSNPNTISLRNDTEADITVPRPILAIGDPIFDPGDEDNLQALMRPVFKGWDFDHDDASRLKFAICQGPIRDGESTEHAILSGQTWVKINITTETEQFHWFAEPDTTELMNLTGAGIARVLWMEEGTGDKWGLIEIGQFAAPTMLGKTTAAHNKDVTRAITIYGPAIPDYTVAKGSETTQSFEVNAYNRYGDLGDGVWVEVQWRRNGWELINGEC